MKLNIIKTGDFGMFMSERGHFFTPDLKPGDIAFNSYWGTLNVQKTKYSEYIGHYLVTCHVLPDQETKTFALSPIEYFEVIRPHKHIGPDTLF